MTIRHAILVLYVLDAICAAGVIAHYVLKVI